MYIRKIIVAILIIGVLIGGIMVYRIYRAIFSPNTAFNNKEAYVYIPTGASFSEVKNRVQPLVKNLESFELVAEKKGYNSHVKGGKYRISKGMNNHEIINALRSNNIPVKISFNNQETLEKLAGRIAGQIEADSSSLVKAFRDEDFLAANKFTLKSSLGMYIPNTYEFFWNTNAELFRDRMFKEYKNFWNQDRLNKARDMGLSENEVIALASIVHEETVKVSERPRVAGVYLNRLKRGMLLQADPTVIYAIKERTGNYDTVIKRVLYKDLELDSPYNTYKYAGLPPGPIAMPDISAVDAVLNAEKHKYLYFVANVEKFGYHKFASTLAQHNLNKREYIRWINSQNIKR